MNGNRFATGQILKKPVEVVKGQISAGRAQKSPEHWLDLESLVSRPIMPQKISPDTDPGGGLSGQSKTPEFEGSQGSRSPCQQNRGHAFWMDHVHWWMCRCEEGASALI